MRTGPLAGVGGFFNLLKTEATMPNPVQRDELLRLSQVLQLVPVSRSQWYQGVKEGRYPAAVKLSARAVAWRSSAIYSLIASL